MFGPSEAEEMAKVAMRAILFLVAIGVVAAGLVGFGAGWLFFR